MKQHWSTDELPVRDQQSYWSDVLCQAFTPLLPWRTRTHWGQSQHPDGFTGSVSAMQVGDVEVADVRSCSQFITHGANQVSRAASEDVFVNFQLNGSCMAEQDGRLTRIATGDFGVFDTTRPYRFEYLESVPGDPWRVLCVKVPRERVAHMVSPHRLLTARAISTSGGMGRVLSSTMRGVWAADLAGDPVAHEASGLFVDLLRLTLQHATGDIAQANPRDDDARRAAVIDHVSRRIGQGRVSAAEAASSIGVSVRRLHQLFAASGRSFGDHVTEARVHAAVQHLRDKPDVTIADVAAIWGYADAGHFSRTVRRLYDCTPSDLRKEAHGSRALGRPSPTAPERSD